METETVLILLPTEYNPDKKGKRRSIPMTEFQKTAVEIDEKFGLGGTINPYPKHGIWVDLGVVYEDVNVTLEINNLSKVEKKRFIKYCKDTLLDRFKQKEIIVKFISKVQVKFVTKKVKNVTEQ